MRVRAQGRLLPGERPVTFSAVIRAEDCHEALTLEGSARFEIRLRLEDHQDISQESEQYLSASWLPWANQERPRRRSIGLYQKLFELVQLAELGGSDQAI